MLTDKMVFGKDETAGGDTERKRGVLNQDEVLIKKEIGDALLRRHPRPFTSRCLHDSNPDYS